jgi:superfamily II DNA/RNA helicase
MHAMLRADMPAKWEAWLAECETRNLLAEPRVVFAHYKDSLNWLDAKLKESGVSFVRVDGDTTQAERSEAVRAFQAGEVDVFLGQTTAAGISTNLVRAAHSAMWDATHKAIDYAQALRRTRRRGQRRVCLHLDLCSNALQMAAVERVRAGRDFNASHASWVAAKAKIALLTPGTSTV